MIGNGVPSGKQLRAARALVGMRQVELASEVGVPRPRIVDIERGHVPPTPAEATKLTQALHKRGVAITRDGGVAPVSEMVKRRDELSYEDDLARAKIRRFMYHPEGLVVTDADLAGYRLAVLWLTGAGDSVEAHGPASRFQTTDHAAVSSENALATFSRLLVKRGLARSTFLRWFSTPPRMRRTLCTMLIPKEA
jgi:DNA-binding XRE family transcriptional regulator